MRCRFCNNELSFEFVDLVNAPPSNSYLTFEQLNEPEVFYPLRLFVCSHCMLVQIDEYKKSAEIFNNEYAYFSSFSISWLKHCEKYVEQIITRLGLNENSLVLEVASNDGYLLQYFKEHQIPCLGIEPTANTAEVAKKKGIETIVEFFGIDLANKLAATNQKADLIIGNNVFAHVPDIHDFVNGLKIALNPHGSITLEFPHVLQLINHVQFDTIYHEHFSYFSLFTVKQIVEHFHLEIYDVDELPTHGGSLRVYLKHASDVTKEISHRVSEILEKEIAYNLNDVKGYENFQQKVDSLKNEFLKFLLEQKLNKKNIVAYGAAAKGNTFLNYCGIKSDLISFVVDASPSKQGKFLPASHIPIVTEAEIKITKPEFIIVLPWNIKDEVIKQLDYIVEWDGKFVIAIPSLKII
jgi:2-polyprenyl-3-methyl-5-hydroxy-6-metoxy-1,4-benzoquinol methylase